MTVVGVCSNCGYSGSMRKLIAPVRYNCPRCDAAWDMMANGQVRKTEEEASKGQEEGEEVDAAHPQGRKLVPGQERQQQGALGAQDGEGGQEGSGWAKQVEAESQAQEVARQAYEAGYGHGYGNAWYDADNDEERSPDQGDSFEIWWTERKASE